MSIKRDLKREGIEVISKIDTLSINKIARNVANVLNVTFPELKLNTKELFINISRLNMCYAKLPKGISAKYFYKNKTIYFDYNLEEKNVSNVAIHECIHFLQERCEKDGSLLRLGLCDYTDEKLPGTGLNEAAVQLMAAKSMGNQYENVKYFDINILSNTPSYYPLECALVNQMAYVIGENVLFDSTINANNNFKEQFISLTSEKTFYTIQKHIDLLVEAQAELENLYVVLQEYDTDEKFAKQCTNEIEKHKEKIRKLFLGTQKLIFTSYFDNSINLAYTPKLIENYRNKLYLFKNLIGQVDGDNFYNEYYIDKMMELEKKYDADSTEIRDLVVVKHNFVSTLFRKLKLLFGFNPDYAGIKNIN